MFHLTERAKQVQKRMGILDGRLTDYQVCLHHLPALVDLIEEMESMTMSCRKTIAGYMNELPDYRGMIDERGDKNEKNLMFKQLCRHEKSVTVKLENEIITLSIFPLMKSLSSRTKEYISLVVRRELEELFQIQPMPEYNENCVLVVNTMYSSPMKIRDNDSVEIAAIVNAFRSIVIKDDSIDMSIYRIGCISDRNETEISLMKQSDFLLWLLRTSGAQEATGL